MKTKISLSIDEEKVRKLEEMLKDGRFRNKSHIVEYSIDKMLKEENGKN